MNNCSSTVEVAGRVISHFHSLQVDEHCSLIEDYSNELNQSQWSEAPF